MKKDKKRKQAVHNPIAAFDCGRLVVSHRVQNTIRKRDLAAALRRHTSCDWGDISDHLWTENDAVLKTGGWLLSAYDDETGRRLMIATDLKKHKTTVRFPCDSEAA